MTWRPTHVAFLRAINVGGRRLRMAEIVDALGPLELGEVRTWQATGNLIFAGELPSSELEQRIPAVLGDALGFEVPAVVRTVAEVRAIAAARPFTDEQLAGTQGRLQVLLVRDEPDEDAAAAVLALGTGADRLSFDDRVLWWLPQTGVSDSSLPVRRVEQLLGVSTMRTHRAVAGLVERHIEPADV